MKNVIIAFAVSISFLSCTSKEERTQWLHELEKYQSRLTDTQMLISEFEQRLNESKVELELRRDELDRAKQFQLLRTESEREQQVRVAAEEVLSAESQVREISDMIIALKDSAALYAARLDQLREKLKD